MGTQYDFKCENEKCNFEIKRVSGGTTRIMRGEIQTRICRKCKNVTDRNITLIKNDFSKSDSSSDIEDRINSGKGDIPFDFEGLTRKEYIDFYLKVAEMNLHSSSYNVPDQNCSQCDRKQIYGPVFSTL
jgi:hypothetical protein